MEENIKHIDEEISIFWKAACFLVPLIGFFMYLFNLRAKREVRAKSALVAGIAGMILNILMFWMNSYFEAA